MYSSEYKLDTSTLCTSLVDLFKSKFGWFGKKYDSTIKMKDVNDADLIP